MITQVNTLAAPVWAGDFMSREHLVPGGAKIDASQFHDTDAVLVKLSAGASAGAVSISFDALSGPVPSGTILDFQGAGKFALTTAAAATGATSVAVEALPDALTDNDEAWYEGDNKHLKVIRSGTLVGRTFAERTSGTAFGAAVDSDDEIYLVAYDVLDADTNNDVDLYRHGGIVKEDLLPDWTAISGNANLLADLRSNYTTVKGVA